MNLNTNSAEIEAAAAAWFEKREWSDWDVAAEQALESWLSESTAHRIAFLRLETAWEGAERLKVLGVGTQAGSVPNRASFGFAEEKPAVLQSEPPSDPLLVVPDKRNSARLGWAIGVASAAAAVILVVWYRSAAQWQLYGTPVGTIAPVALSDGSRITLDSNTQIQVAFETDRRLIRLDKGKALFEVAKDIARPMVVEVADKRVTAVGTEFLVQRDAQDVKVLVKEGRVRLQNSRHLDDKYATELSAGDKASFPRGELATGRMKNDEVERELSWREGYLEFHETPLPEVVAEFNRYRTQKIEIDDPRINSIRIGGRFRCTDGNSFLALLQQGFPVVVTSNENHVGLHRR